jgi:phosphoglycolate phosphatase-like HAD superfamily hydrolase
MTKLVLFDIDGTLIDPGGIGRRSVTKAFHEVLSVKDAFSDIKMAGKTDIQIIKEALTLHGLSSGDGVIPGILSRYLNILKQDIDTENMSIKPGVIDLLNYLEATEDIYLGLLTGNIEKGGRAKLSAFDLNRYFPFGAFGDDSEDRNELLPVAVKKFRTMANIDIRFSDCIVIGDTPNDVQCSSPLGAISIAVATGPYSYDLLLETGADYVLRDLSCAKELKLFSPLYQHGKRYETLNI